MFSLPGDGRRNWTRRSVLAGTTGLALAGGVRPAQAAPVKNGIPQVSVKELKARLDGKEARNDNFLLLDVREPYEFQIAQIGGKLIGGDAFQGFGPVGRSLRSRQFQLGSRNADQPGKLAQVGGRERR